MHDKALEKYNSIQKQRCFFNIRTYKCDSRSDVLPAEFPPDEWVVANHLLHHFIPPVNPKEPANSDALHAHQADNAHTGCSVGIEQLEHVHASLQENIA